MPTTRTLFDLWPKANLGHVFLTSYTFHAAFFEARLLPELQGRRADSVTVLVDAAVGYQAATAALALLHSVGITWLLVPVCWPNGGAFHPKVHLFTGSDVAVVGSGNLTPSGCGGNLEAFDRLDAAEDGTAVAQARSFFRRLLALDAVRLPPDQRARLLSFVAQSGDPKPCGSAGFFSSVDGPTLFKSVTDRWPAMEPASVLMASPFHDHDHGLSRRLAAALRGQTVRLVAQPDEIPPPSRLAAGWTTGRALGRRHMHAKLLHASTDEMTMLVTGSANLTHPAWFGKNCEALVVRTDLERTDTFDAALPPEWFEPCSWTGAADEDDAVSSHQPTLPALWATLHGDQVRIQVAVSTPGTTWSAESGEDCARVLVVPEDASGLLLCGTWPLSSSAVSVLHGKAPGWSEVRLVVVNTALLGKAPRVIRVRQALDRLLRGCGTELDANELFAVIGDFLLAASTPGARARTHADVPTGAAATLEQVSQDPIDRVAELVLGRSHAGCAARTVADRLLQVVDQLRKMDSGRDLAARSGADDPESTAPGQDDTAEPTPQLHSAIGDDCVSVDNMREALRRAAGAARTVAAADPERAVALFESAIGALGWLRARRSRPNECALQALGWLTDAFAVADWPAVNTRGWVLARDCDPPALYACIDCFQWVVDELGGLDAGRVGNNDMVRIARGIHAVAAGASTGELVDALRALPTRGDVGHQAVRLLWALDAANSGVRATRTAISDLEGEEAELRHMVETLVPRNRKHKAALERLVALRPEVQTLRTKLEWQEDSLCRAIEAAASATLQSGTIIYKAWRRISGNGKRDLTARVGSMCSPPCCIGLPTALETQADPAEPVVCSHCGRALVWPAIEDISNA